MSNNQVVIDTLVKKRESLIGERQAAILRFNEGIQELETALEVLSGKRVWETIGEVAYDDTNPDYIKGSLEEL